jgi:hypothetical protein
MFHSLFTHAVRRMDPTHTERVDVFVYDHRAMENCLSILSAEKTQSIIVRIFAGLNGTGIAIKRGIRITVRVGDNSSPSVLFGVFVNPPDFCVLL